MSPPDTRCAEALWQAGVRPAGVTRREGFPYETCSFWHLGTAWQPETHIQDAWAVLEWIEDHGGVWEIVTMHEGKRGTFVGCDFPHGFASKMTPYRLSLPERRVPEAICRIALAIMENER